jgi:broad specificity phosphatase PhoE
MTVKHTEMFLVRHGQTDSNVAGLFHGATDVPLNDTGLLQAQLVAGRIHREESLNALHTSPMLRALRTAEAISLRTGLSLHVQQDLSEMDFGEAEGLTIGELRQRYMAIMQRFADPADADVAFPGGESRGAFHRRVRVTLDRIATAHQGERIVVVAHGGVISSAVAQMRGEDPTDWRKYHVANCSVTHVELASDGPITHVFNDIVHLEELTIELPVGE